MTSLKRDFLKKRIDGFFWNFGRRCQINDGYSADSLASISAIVFELSRKYGGAIFLTRGLTNAARVNPAPVPWQFERALLQAPEADTFEDDLTLTVHTYNERNTEAEQPDEGRGMVNVDIGISS